MGCCGCTEVDDGSGGGGSGNAAYALPEQWAQEDVTADQTDVPLSAQVSINFDDVPAMRAGSIVGLSTRLTEAVLTGTLTVTVSINGVAGTLNAASTAGSNPTGAQVTQATGVDSYVAGDLIGLLLTTTADFTPQTTDLEAWVEVAETAP